MRILIDRNSCRGDILAATCILPGLKRKYPEAIIDWTVLNWGGFGDSLLHNPYVDNVVYNFNPLDYDLIIHPDHQSDWRAPMEQIYCEQLGIPFHGPELYLTPEELAFADELQAPYIVAVVHAGWGTRVWAYEKWTALALALHQQGRRIYQVIAPGEPAIAGMDLHLQCSLRQAAAVISRASLYVGADTWGMHAAVALDTPVVAIMCPTGPQNQWLGPNATAVTAGYEPCTWSGRTIQNCPYQECPTCGGSGEPGIHKIVVEAVEEEIVKLLVCP